MIKHLLQLEEQRHAKWIKERLRAHESAGGTTPVRSPASQSKGEVGRLNVALPAEVRSLARRFLQEMQRRCEERSSYAPSFNKMQDLVAKGGWGGSKKAYNEIATDYAMLHLGPSAYRCKRISKRFGNGQGGVEDAAPWKADIQSEEERREDPEPVSEPMAKRARKAVESSEVEAGTTTVTIYSNLHGGEAESDHFVTVRTPPHGLRGVAREQPAMVQLPWSEGVDMADRRNVGRWGEALVHQILIAQCGVNGDSVKWLNEDGETMAPYDLVLEEACSDGRTKSTFVEVKTTSTGRNCFEVSPQEWDFVQRGVNGGGSDNYRVYRVYVNPANPASPVVVRVDDVYRAIVEGEAKLCIAIPSHLDSQK